MMYFIEILPLIDFLSSHTSRVKLIDFGVAFQREKPLKDFHGHTSIYMAPDVRGLTYPRLLTQPSLRFYPQEVDYQSFASLHPL